MITKYSVRGLQIAHPEALPYQAADLVRAWNRDSVAAAGVPTRYAVSGLAATDAAGRLPAEPICVLRNVASCPGIWRDILPCRAAIALRRGHFAFAGWLSFQRLELDHQWPPYHAGACLLPAHVLQLRTHGELDIQVRSGTRSMCSLYSLDIYGDWELPRVLYGFSNTRHDRVYLQFCRLCELMEYAVLCRKQSYARLIIELHYDQIIMSGLVKWADGTQHRLQQGPTLVPRQ